MLRTTLFAVAAASGLTSCATPDGEAGYAAPNWTRGICMSTDWRRQGASDARRYADPQRRLAALERSCGGHISVPRAEYLAGYAAGE